MESGTVKGNANSQIEQVNHRVKPVL
jgi:hypothetical protein